MTLVLYAVATLLFLYVATKIVRGPRYIVFDNRWDNPVSAHYTYQGARFKSWRLNRYHLSSPFYWEYHN